MNMRPFQFRSHRLRSPLTLLSCFFLFLFCFCFCCCSFYFYLYCDLCITLSPLNAHSTPLTEKNCSRLYPTHCTFPLTPRNGPTFTPPSRIQHGKLHRNLGYNLAINTFISYHIGKILKNDHQTLTFGHVSQAFFPRQDHSACARCTATDQIFHFLDIIWPR